MRKKNKRKIRKENKKKAQKKCLYLLQKINFLDQKQFTRLIELLFALNGFQVKKREVSKAKGVDIYVRRNNQVYYVLVHAPEAPESLELVGEDSVIKLQEIVGKHKREEDMYQGLIITNTSFSLEAITASYQGENRIELIDIEILNQLQLNYYPHLNRKKIK